MLNAKSAIQALAKPNGGIIIIDVLISVKVIPDCMMVHVTAASVSIIMKIA